MVSVWREIRSTLYCGVNLMSVVLGSLLGKMAVLDEVTKNFLFHLADVAGVRKSKVLEAYELAKRAEILNVKECGDEILGVRIRVESESRRGEVHYVSVGKFGAKCTCEFSVIRRGLCKHILAGLIVWYAVSMLRFGKPIDLDSLEWLKQMREGKEEKTYVRSGEEEVDDEDALRREP